MKNMKKNLSFKTRFALKHAFHTLKAFINYAYDARRFMRYSCVLRKKNDFNLLLTGIMMHVHSIERALSLKNVRPGFGKKKISNLTELLYDYLRLGFDTTSSVFVNGISVLNSYLIFHEKKGYKYDIPVQDILFLKSFLPVFSQRAAGIKEMTREQYLRNMKVDFRAFAMNRVSIRDFSNKKVDLNILKEAIRIAQRSPSVCNRQSVRVYLIDNDAALKDSLKMLNGIRGFDDLIQQLLIITSDLSSFINIGERNQCYIDGGIFLMSLLYGLQSQGLGACTLNWSVENNKDRALRKICAIKEQENIIALIAVGYVADRFSVPMSARLDTEEIVRIV